MRTIAITLTVQLLAAATVWAQNDEVTPYGADGKSAGIKFSGVTISDFNKDYKLEFSDGTKTYSKLAREIKQIKLGDKADFSKAEDMAAKGEDGAKVVAQYNKAAGSMSSAWQKRLFQVRRLQAASGSGMIGTAVDDWVKLAKENNKYDSVIIDMVPKTVGPKGSEENKKAIDILKANTSATNAAFKKTVTDLLMNVLTAEDRAEEAAALAGAGGTTGGTESGSGGTTLVPNVAVGVASINALLAAKKYDDCISQTKAGLKNFSNNDLPDALFILGQAQLIKGKESGNKEMISEAGLNFMRVYTFFEAYPRVGDALLNAGVACKELGNLKGAQIAFSKVLERYRDKPELVKKAQESLAQLNK